MNFAILVMFDLSQRVVTVTMTIILILLMQNVWALALGPTIGALYGLIVSHTVLEGLARRYGNAPPGRNWFAWDRDAVKHLIRFGRWIFLATALTYLCGQGDRVILAGFLSDTQLGVYAVAALLATAVQEGLRRVSLRVLFPILSRLAEQSPGTLKKKLRRARMPLHAATLPAMCVLAIFGNQIVELLYSQEFQEAGPILRVLATGYIFRIITITAAPVILASGDSFRHMIRMVGEGIILIVAMAVGGTIDGYFGVVVGIAATPLLSYPIHVWAIDAHHAWMPRFDFLWMIGCAIVVLVGSLLFT